MMAAAPACRPASPPWGGSLISRCALVFLVLSVFFV